MDTIDLILKLFFTVYASGVMAFSLYSIKWIRDAEHIAYRAGIRDMFDDLGVKKATRKWALVNIPLLVGILVMVYGYTKFF